MSATDANKFKLKLGGASGTIKVKREADSAVEPEIRVKREVIDIDDGGDQKMGVTTAPPPPVAVKRERPSFTVSATSSAYFTASDPASAASSSASAATSSSAPAAPVVLNQQTQRQRMRKRPKSILDYLCSLSKPILDALYTDRFTCLTIFRSLHPLAKQYLLRWLCVTDGIPLSIVNSWIMATPISQQAHTQAMTTLWELQILMAGERIDDDTQTYDQQHHQQRAQQDMLIHFNPSFQRSLQHALSNHQGSTAAENLLDHGDDPRTPPTAGALEEYASRTWDTILHWMVGASKTLGVPQPEVMSRLVGMGLMEPLTAASSSAPATKPKITTSGFAFLFKDIQTQVWDIILSYMDTLHELQWDRNEILQFLFRLSFLKLGAGYPIEGLTETQKKLLHQLSAFGLIYINRDPARARNASSAATNGTFYYPTRLALNLSSASGGPAATTAAAAASSSSSSTAAAASSSNSPQAGEGYIILETTFRFYAFTTSPFHTALLGLFCRLDISLPNLIIGTITKESVRSALKNNISSNEIISYLETYAKADMRVNNPILPENVVDQIRLWEQERNRMSLTESYLFEFDANDTDDVIRAVLQEAFRVSSEILLHHTQKKLLVVSPSGYTRLKAFKLRLNEEMAKAGVGKKL